MRTRRDLLNMLIKEIEKEIKQAEKDQNLIKKYEMENLKATIIKIRDGVS